MTSCHIPRHHATGRESGAAGDAVVQPEDAAEQRKASGVARTCSSTAEGVAVRRMPRGDAKWTGRDIAEYHGMAVEVSAARGCCEKAGGRQDHSGRWCREQVWRRKTSHEAEDTSEGGRHVGRWKTRQEWKQSLRRKGVAQGGSPYSGWNRIWSRSGSIRREV